MIDLVNTNIPVRLAFAAPYATAHAIDVALLCAVIEHESSWDQHAIRFEPAFYQKYIQQMSFSDTEEYTRAMSWGLMQIMGETAREFGFKGHYMSELCDPEFGMTFGCLKLAKCLSLHSGDPVKALSSYNGGSDPSYPITVMNLRQKYL